MQPDWNKVKAIRLMKSGGWRTWLWRHRSTYFAAVHVLDGRFAESEVDVVAVGERTGEVGCCVQKQKTIVSIQTSLCAPLGCSKNPCKSPRGIFSWPLAHSSSHQELSKDPFQNVLMCLQAPAPTQNLQKWANSPKMAVFYDHHFHYCYHESRKKKTILEMSLPLSLVASYCSDRRGSRRIRGSIPEKSATVPAYSCSSVPQKIITKKKIK